MWTDKGLEYNQKTTIYVSGPMSGYPEHNFPAFEAAAKDLRARHFVVISPHENDGGDTSNTWHYYMRQDIIHVAQCNQVLVLEGWENSRGARVEVFLAKMLNIPINHYPSFEPVNEEAIEKACYNMVRDYFPEKESEESMVDEARRLVSGDRQSAYGHPFHDFSRTATMWTGLLSEKLQPGKRIEPEEIGMAMVLLKLSRQMNKKKRDNIVDAHGYLITVDMVQKYRKENNV